MSMINQEPGASEVPESSPYKFVLESQHMLDELRQSTDYQAQLSAKDQVMAKYEEVLTQMNGELRKLLSLNQKLESDNHELRSDNEAKKTQMAKLQYELLEQRQEVEARDRVRDNL